MKQKNVLTTYQKIVISFSPFKFKLIVIYTPLKMDEHTEDQQYVESKIIAMNEELDYLSHMYKEGSKELESFKKLFERYLQTKDQKIDWDKITNADDLIIDYHEHKISKETKTEMLNKLAVIKLNGGLGTTMGLTGPKSKIEVRDGNNFIDLVIKQIKHFNCKYESSVPLILMNSFNTQKETEKMIKGSKNITIKTFNQFKYPKISVNTKLPITGDKSFYPPGHGNLYEVLYQTKLLDELINEGKEYLFISNIDNLSSTIDLNILRILDKGKADFIMEVTDKTTADIKGGTLVKYNDVLRLIEVAMVPQDHVKEFIKKFKVFNTNSLWINLKSLKEVVTKLKLDIIQNRKVVDGQTVIQLETAVGSAIQYFKNPIGLKVSRERFSPVKSCSDLFLVESNLYKTDKGTLVRNEKRLISGNPTVKFIGRNFNNFEKYKKTFLDIPDIIDLDFLVLSGTISFGRKIVLKGTVVIIAPEGSKIDIPDGTILEDKVVYGNCSMMNIK